MSWVLAVFQKPSIQHQSVEIPIPIESLEGVEDHDASPTPRPWHITMASIALVLVPVFFQAPLVRAFPWVSLMLTLGWLGGAIALIQRKSTLEWGDLLLGFTWTWLAGSIYWGWLRWEPFLHLPIEAIGLPFALWGIRYQQHKIGHWFYIGSLLGTAITDLYFYLVNLIPYWRQVMQVSPAEAQLILHQALLPMRTSWGYGCAVSLVGMLLVAGCIPLQSKRLHWRAFSGAVLSTLLVDGLFWVAAAIS
ncbi:MAG: DUF3120 domain-containing protein [Symploca sp. SIO3C6]|nr:DUF3120 domain-containing protein [Symploca sp. SIO3C6]